MNDSHDADPPSSGIMVIRAWNEAGRADSLRARLTFGTGDDARSTVLADGDEVIEAVRAWLATFTAPPGGPRTETSP